MLPPGYQITASLRDVIVPLLLIYTILLPADLAPQIGGLVLPPYRIAILVLAPFAISQMLKHKDRPTLPDILIFAGSLWGFCAMLMTSSIVEGLEGGGSFALDGLGSYFIGRAYITDVRKLRTLLIFLLPGMLIIGGIMAIEAISHRMIIAPLFGAPESTGVRLGLMRAKAVFPHPIAAGLFMGSLLSLYFLSHIRLPLRILGTIAALTAVFAGSSAAYLMTAILLLLILYRSFFTDLLRTRERLGYLVIAAAFVFVFLELATGRGAIRFLIQFTLDPQTGYFRLLIWTHGTASVANNPWFGIGNAPLPRPDWMIRETIDNHWLFLAVRYGLPTGMLTLGSVIAAVWHCVVGNRRLNGFDRATTSGAVFALIALTLVAWTVALWANHFAWYMLLVGVVAALGNQLPRSPARIAPHMGAGPIMRRRPA